MSRSLITLNYTWRVLTLPLDYTAIERILPHRYPFLLVDRVTELEPDKRIVGIKNVSQNESYLFPMPGGRPSLPPTILTEILAQAVYGYGAVRIAIGEREGFEEVRVLHRRIFVEDRDNRIALRP